MILKLINTSNDDGGGDNAIDPNACDVCGPNAYDVHNDIHGYDANKRN
ncbi:hypothetical protein [Legionella rowbothamii]|nr:hypothetical protein [Legionella rowbothamii]